MILIFLLFSAKSANNNREVELSEEQLSELWDSVSGGVSALLQSGAEGLPEGVTPFDAASDISMDQQR